VKQLGRFLRIERARQDTGPEQPAAPGRFDTLEEALPADREPAAAPAPAGSLERFTPEPEAPLAFEIADDEQPFVRCPRCSADSVRHARACRGCEATLDTDEVRAFNARLWAEMRAAGKREAAEAAERKREQEAASGAGAAERKRFAEELAASVGARERARLAREGLWPSAGPGWAILRTIADRRLRALALLVALGLPLTLLLLSRRGSAGTVVGLVGLLVAAFLLVPRRQG